MPLMKTHKKPIRTATTTTEVEESVMEIEMATAAPFHGGVPRLSLNGNASHLIFGDTTKARTHHSHELLASHFSTPRASQCYNIDQYCINRELMGKRNNQSQCVHVLSRC